MIENKNRFSGRVATLLRNRMLRTFPLPVSATELYFCISEQQVETLESLVALACKASGYMRMADTLSATAEGYRMSLHFKEEMPKDSDIYQSTLDLDRLGVESRAAMRQWMHDAGNLLDELHRITEAVEFVARQSNTLGHMLRMWPAVKFLLTPYEKQQAQSMLRKAPMPPMDPVAKQVWGGIEPRLLDYEAVLVECAIAEDSMAIRGEVPPDGGEITHTGN